MSLFFSSNFQNMALVLLSSVFLVDSLISAVNNTDQWVDLVGWPWTAYVCHTVMQQLCTMVYLRRQGELPWTKGHHLKETWAGYYPWGLWSVRCLPQGQGSLSWEPQPLPALTWRHACQSHSDPAGTAAQNTACTSGSSCGPGCGSLQIPPSTGSPQQSMLWRNNHIA